LDEAEVEAEAVRAAAPVEAAEDIFGAVVPPDFDGKWLCTKVEGDMGTLMYDMGVSMARRSMARAGSYGVGTTVQSLKRAGAVLKITTTPPNATVLHQLDGTEYEAEVLGQNAMNVMTHTATSITLTSRLLNGDGGFVSERYFDGELMCVRLHKVGKEEGAVVLVFEKQLTEEKPPVEEASIETTAAQVPVEGVQSDATLFAISCYVNPADGKRSILKSPSGRGISTDGFVLVGNEFTEEDCTEYFFVMLDFIPNPEQAVGVSDAKTAAVPYRHADFPWPEERFHAYKAEQQPKMAAAGLEWGYGDVSLRLDLVAKEAGTIKLSE